MITHRWKLNPRKRYGWGKHFEPDYYFWQALVPRTTRNDQALMQERIAWDDGTGPRHIVRVRRGGMWD